MLRITLVNAYCPFYSSYHVVTFVIAYSRNSYVKVTSNLHRTRLQTPHYVFTLVIGFARISGSSPGPVGRRGDGATAPLAPAVRRCDANVEQTSKHTDTA